MIVAMNDRHKDPPLTVRPPAHLQASAKDTLQQRNHTIGAFITACLTAVTVEPDRLLQLLAPHWPTPKPLGRPRKKKDT